MRPSSQTTDSFYAVAGADYSRAALQNPYRTLLVNEIYKASARSENACGA